MSGSAKYLKANIDLKNKTDLLVSNDYKLLLELQNISNKGNPRTIFRAHNDTVIEEKSDVKNSL